MLDGFKKFILRGNVVDMAVGVVIGAAFGGVVAGLTKAFITPLIAVLPVNALIARMNRGEKPPDPTTKKCPECLSEIPIDARRCSHCTQPVMGKAA